MPTAVTVTLQPARVIVDPNSVVRGEPGLTAARFDDADRVPHVGEIVVASQPDSDGSDFIGSARVVRVNTEYRLIFLSVDWASYSISASSRLGLLLEVGSCASPGALPAADVVGVPPASAVVVVAG